MLSAQGYNDAIGGVTGYNESGATGRLCRGIFTFFTTQNFTLYNQMH